MVRFFEIIKKFNIIDMSKPQPQYAKSVMFVCLGNIIRSPLCEGLLKTLVHGIKVDSSAVTTDDIDQSPHKHSRRIAKEHGFDISNHISKLIRDEDFYNFDLIVSLEGYVGRELKYIQPKGSPARIVPFASYDISNPWCNPYKDFVTMYAEIEKEMQTFIKTYINPENINK